MNCADLFTKIIEPPNERCCTEEADIRTLSSDCSSCRSIVIPEIIESDDSSPIIISQCIWNPAEQEAAPIEVVMAKDTKPAPKKKKSKKKTSQTSLVQTADDNLPELNEFVTLPLYDQEVAELIFGEILLISFLSENPLKCSEDIFNFKCNKYVSIGGFCNNIQRDGHNIIVYSASQFSCNGKATRSSIYSLCDNSLNLIEEKRIESYVDENGETREKSLHLIKESVDGTNDNKRIIAFRTENENKMVLKYHTKIKINLTGALVPDGLNFVLLRHLAIIQFVGTFNTWTINIKGHICRSEYIFKPIKTYKINSKNRELIKVIRNITSQENEPQIIKMFFLPTGHMIRHAWEYYPFIIHINPLASIPPSGFILNSFDTWQQHIELVSNYLDCKDKAQSKLKTYLNDKPEVRCMIKDYIALLLQLKPVNILKLTVEYFMNLHGDVQNVMEEMDEETESEASYYNSLGTDSDEDEDLVDEPDEKWDNEEP